MSLRLPQALGAAMCAVLASTLTLTSCIEEKEPTFSPQVTGYVVQTDSAGHKVFSPYIQMNSLDLRFPLDTVEFFSSKTRVPMKRVNDYIFCSEMKTSVTDDVTKLNADFSLQARTKQADFWQKTIIYKFEEAKDTLEDFKIVSDLEYKGDYFNARFLKDKNAVAYGVAFTPYNEENDVIRRVDRYFWQASLALKGDTVSLSYGFSTSIMGTKLGEARIYAVTANGVLRESTQAITIRK